MHILVTGGAGFIGSHICEYLIMKNHKVRVFDNLSSGFMKNIEKLLENDNFEFVKGDISNIEDVKKACDNIDAICHQAAIGSVPRSILDPLNSHNSNINGFLNILLVAKELGIKRVVYASSSSVYGDDKSFKKTEDVTGSLLSPYALTKYVDELYAKMFSRLYSMECIGLRYFNIFGPRQNPNGPYAAVIPKFITNIREGKESIINGDGSFSRDFTYIDNAVLANYLALTTEKDTTFGKVFNIACGSRYTILELFNIIKSELKINCEPVFGSERIGDIPHSFADISKAKELLDYYVRVNFEDGIKYTVEHF